jgi:tRNA U34 5-methylaminomethyl-2-thiouridine-forming methyltransferase MnmC
MQNSNPLVPYLTGDGSYTFFSEEYGETFHSHSGAKEEAEKKFIHSCRIGQKAQEQSGLRILDICYGLGYNSAAALATIWQIAPNCHIELIALEQDERVIRSAIANGLLDHYPSSIPEILARFAREKSIQTPNLQAQLLLGDARQTLQAVRQRQFQADAIFLDPFSPTKCPQLWTVEFLNLAAQCLNPRGYLATYSCAASVRTALRIAGLHVGATASVGRRSPGTIASWDRADLPPLSQPEIEHLRTRAAIPYRDPQLTDTSALICRRREAEQKASDLEVTSHWKKRWKNYRKKTDLHQSDD